MKALQRLGKWLRRTCTREGYIQAATELLTREQRAAVAVLRKDREEWDQLYGSLSSIDLFSNPAHRTELRLMAARIAMDARDCMYLDVPPDIALHYVPEKVKPSLSSL